ncbi:hypothetical protein EUX98_g5003 [Antrodiella citrinella]|uniref:Protein kinase domain-containing protein n=1 Tax=Antrodiella citrinella TaxID=2447956 RepID=A0A4S4MSM2_9APHY|nr:hypothetical protein EUX98_g5003 [Antrodiella citrinella]
MAESENIELMQSGSQPPSQANVNILALIDSAISKDPMAVPDISRFDQEEIAISALDVLWDLLGPSEDEVKGINSHRPLPTRALRSLASALAEKYDIIPQAFFLPGVRCHERASRGAGAFTDVYVGQCDGHGRVALKRLRVDMKGRQAHELRVLRQFYHESLMWRKLNHEYVLPFLGVSNDAFGFAACMVIPWMEKGTIRQYVGLLRQDGKLSGKQFVTSINKWLYQTILGLAYLHNEGLVHGDLHGGNILIDDSDNARLTDFSLNTIATKVAEYYYSSKYSAATYQYQAPELHDPQQFGMDNVTPMATTATDIYSFGCVCVELYGQQAPFSGAAYFKVAKDVLDGKRPPRPSTPDEQPMSDSMWKLTRRCWAQNVSDRPSAKKVAKDLEMIVSGKWSISLPNALTGTTATEIPGTPRSMGSWSKIPRILSR